MLPDHTILPHFTKYFSPGAETIQQMANRSEAYRNFIDSINSEASRYEYAKNIRYFLHFTGLPDYDSLLTIGQQQIETIVRDYIVYLRQTKRLAPATVSNYVSGSPFL